jgi:hypothetical protein
MECQVMDYLVHDTPWGLIWKARSWTIWFMITFRTNIESQVTDYLIHDTLGD